MEGYADFKSHILRRDEKGVFGIPFKRLLGCGLGAGAILTVAKLPFPDWSIQIGLVSFLLLLFFTAPRGGIPRWRHLVYDGRWRLVTAASVAPQSVLGSLGTLLHLPMEALEIDGSLFRPAEEAAPPTQLTDWVSFTRLTEADRAEGLTFEATPGLLLGSAEETV